MLTVAGAVAAAYWFKRQAELPKRKLPEPWPEVRDYLPQAILCGKQSSSTFNACRKSASLTRHLH